MGWLLDVEDLIVFGCVSGCFVCVFQGFVGCGVFSVMFWDICSGLLFFFVVYVYMLVLLVLVFKDLLLQILDVLLMRLLKFCVQVIYYDFYEFNVLVMFNLLFFVEGVIDFGDMIFGLVVQDFVVVIVLLIYWMLDLVFVVNCLMCGYQCFMLLEEDDFVVFRSFVFVCLLLQVGLVVYQIVVYGCEDVDFEVLQVFYIQVIFKIVVVLDVDFVKGVMFLVVLVSEVIVLLMVLMFVLLECCQVVFGKIYMFYNELLELVCGCGCMVYDVGGNEYFDCYNNVVNVGYCYFYVLDVLIWQVVIFNINLCYLYLEIVWLGEWFLVMFLVYFDMLVFVCIGLEVNDLVVCMVCLIFGNEGVVIIENSYYGNMMIVVLFLLIDYDIKDKLGWVVIVLLLNFYCGFYCQDVNDVGVKYVDYVMQVV